MLSIALVIVGEMWKALATQSTQLSNAVSKVEFASQRGSFSPVPCTKPSALLQSPMQVCILGGPCVGVGSWRFGLLAFRRACCSNGLEARFPDGGEPVGTGP